MIPTPESEARRIFNEAQDCLEDNRSVAWRQDELEDALRAAEKRGEERVREIAKPFLPLIEGSLEDNSTHWDRNCGVKCACDDAQRYRLLAGLV